MRPARKCWSIRGRSMRAYYIGCDYVTPNWKESQGLLGQTESDPTESLILENGAALRKALGSHVILTLGPRGITFFDRDTGAHFNLPTQAREVFDVSGAGDTVVATFALARAAGGGLEDSVRLANKAAGVVVGKFGTATVTREELLDSEPGESPPGAPGAIGRPWRNPSRPRASASSP